MSRFSQAPLTRLQALPWAGGRNKGIQGPPVLTITPRPPQTARTHAEGDVASSGSRAGIGYRTLKSARGRLERDGAESLSEFAKAQLIKAAGAKSCNVRPSRCGYGFEAHNTEESTPRRSVTRTEQSVDGTASRGNVHGDHCSGLTTRKKLACDGSRRGFHRRHKVFSQIEGYEYFTRASEAANTPACQRAVELERQIDDAAIPNSEKTTLRYDLQKVKKRVEQSVRHAADTLDSRSTWLFHAKGGRDETTESDDVVESLFEKEKMRKYAEERMQHEKREQQKKSDDMKYGVISALSSPAHKYVDDLLRFRTKHVHLQGKIAQNPPIQEGIMPVCDEEKTQADLAAANQQHDNDHEVTRRAYIVTGKYKQDTIPRIALTELQAEMLESSRMRLATRGFRLKEAAEKRQQEDTARLLKLKEAEKDDMMADALRKERALERQAERERQTLLKTVSSNYHATDSLNATIREHGMKIRSLLDELVVAPTNRGDVQNKPLEEWDDKQVRKIFQDGQTKTVSQEEMQLHAHRYFVRPVAVAFDSKGNMIVADPENHCVRIVSKDGIEEVLAGSGDPKKGGFADGDASQALFLHPTGIAVDKFDNILVADFNNHRIRMIDHADGVVSTIAGTGIAGHQDGEGRYANLNRPESLAFDSKGNLFVADWGNHRIRKLVQTRKEPAASQLSSSGGGQSPRPDSIEVVASLSFLITTGKDEAGAEAGPKVAANGLPRPSECEWEVMTLAGSGDRGFKDEIGEGARFNHPHGIFVADDGETVMVMDSHVDGSHKPLDDLEALRIATEKEQERLEEIRHLADMAECTHLLRDGDFMSIEKGFLSGARNMNQQALMKLYRWCSHQVGEIDAQMARKRKTLQNSGIAKEDDIDRRLRAARKVEVFKRFQFTHVLGTLRGRDQKYDQAKDKESAEDSSASKMGHMFDDAIITATVVDVDEKLLKSGPKQLSLFRLELSKRFNSVIDAWIFFDMDADGSMSYKEFVVLYGELRMPKEISPHKIFEHVDKNRTKEVTPLTFIRVLTWHKIPESDQEIRLQLAGSRDKRREIYNMATRRIAELAKEIQVENAALAAKTPRLRRGSTCPELKQKRAKVKHPVRVHSFDLARNETDPYFEPLMMKTTVENTPDPTPLSSQAPEQAVALPVEIEEMNWHVSIAIDHRKRTGMERIQEYDQRIDRVSKMLLQSEACLKRGRVWRLRDGCDKDCADSWDTFLMVLIESGKLMFEPDNSALLVSGNSAKGVQPLVLDFDMHTIVKHDTIDIRCLGGSCQEMLFRTHRGTHLVTEYLYIAFGELDGDRLAGEWWNAIRLFSWRADDVNTEHLTTKWKPEEQAIWNEMEDHQKEMRDLRRIIKVQRWFRKCKTQHIEKQRAIRDALESHAELHRLAYVMQQHGPIGEQDKWSQVDAVFAFRKSLRRGSFPGHVAVPQT